jgi:hypothetical protein
MNAVDRRMKMNRIAEILSRHGIEFVRKDDKIVAVEVFSDGSTKDFEITWQTAMRDVYLWLGY